MPRLRPTAPLLWVMDHSVLTGLGLLLVGQLTVPFLTYVGLAILAVGLVQALASIGDYNLPRPGRTRVTTWGCWEVPRAFVARRSGRTLFFSREFDEARRDYSTDFEAYELGTVEGDIHSQWHQLPGREARCLGSVPVAAFRFEGVSERRRYVPTGILDAVLSRRPAAS